MPLRSTSSTSLKKRKFFLNPAPTLQKETKRILSGGYNWQGGQHFKKYFTPKNTRNKVKISVHLIHHKNYLTTKSYTLQNTSFIAWKYEIYSLHSILIAKVTHKNT